MNNAPANIEVVLCLETQRDGSPMPKVDSMTPRVHGLTQSRGELLFACGADTIEHEGVLYKKMSDKACLRNGAMVRILRYSRTR